MAGTAWAVVEHSSAQKHRHSEARMLLVYLIEVGFSDGKERFTRSAWSSGHEGRYSAGAS
jgi:hypothetical protein